MHCFFFFFKIPYSLRNILSNFHIFSQSDRLVGNCTAGSSDQLAWSTVFADFGAQILLGLGPKSYLVWAHKPQISPRHGLGPVLGHVMGFLQPTLGPLGYLLVKERSKCGQLWTLGIEECLWSWGSPRLIGGVLRTEGAQNGVSSEEKRKKKK